MAIEDGVVLAEELAHAPDIAVGLEAFVARRRPRVDWVREQSKSLTELVGLPASAGTALCGCEESPRSPSGTGHSSIRHDPAAWRSGRPLRRPAAAVNTPRPTPLRSQECLIM